MISGIFAAFVVFDRWDEGAPRRDLCHYIDPGMSCVTMETGNRVIMTQLLLVMQYRVYAYTVEVTTKILSQISNLMINTVSCIYVLYYKNNAQDKSISHVVVSMKY